MSRGIRPGDGRKKPLTKRKTPKLVSKKMLRLHPDAGTPIPGSKYVVGYCHLCDTKLRCVLEAASLPTCQDCWGDDNALTHSNPPPQGKYGEREKAFTKSSNVAILVDKRLEDPGFLA